MRLADNWLLYLELENLVNSPNLDNEDRINELRGLLFPSSFRTETKEQMGRANRAKAIANSEFTYIVIEPNGKKLAFDLKKDINKKYGASYGTIDKAIESGQPITNGKNTGMLIFGIEKN